MPPGLEGQLSGPGVRRGASRWGTVGGLAPSARRLVSPCVKSSWGGKRREGAEWQGQGRLGCPREQERGPG